MKKSTTKTTAAKKTASKQTAAKKTASKQKTAKKTPASAPAEGKWTAALAPRAPGERKYWLVKSEPETFSFDDLLRAPSQTTHWDGVRNFAARNFMREGMKRGDLVFFYHSSVQPQAIVGVCEVVREAYPDTSALDPKHAAYDESSDPANPTWFMVDLRAVERLAHPVTLTAIKARPELAQMALVRIGRLSVTPVTQAEWDTIRAMATEG